jgi:hypothetical protein
MLKDLQQHLRRRLRRHSPPRHWRLRRTRRRQPAPAVWLARSGCAQQSRARACIILFLSLDADLSRALQYFLHTQKIKRPVALGLVKGHPTIREISR